MESPVICGGGHTYERAAIEAWLQDNSDSPVTGQPLPSAALLPNHTLRSLIDAAVHYSNNS